jgi:hypothetical protein
MTSTVASVADVQTILRAQGSSQAQLSSDLISSNLRAAQQFIERATHRYFADRPSTSYTFSTNGQPFVDLPGVRNVASATWPAGVSLDFSSSGTAYLIADAQQTGIYTGIQLRPFVRSDAGGPWFYSVPEWFDRALDSPFYPGNYGGGNGRLASIPNDLVITGDWGYADASLPEPFRDAVKILAAWKTLRPGALFSGTYGTPEGNAFDLSGYPIEVVSFITEWSIGQPAVVSIG